MEPLSVVISNPAKREIKKMNKEQQRIVVAALKKLETDPRPRGMEKLKGRPDFLRIRAGAVRLVYTIINNQLVLLLLVRDRKDAYKNLDGLEERLKGALKQIETRGNVVRLNRKRPG